jgi:hypothetical protein
MLEIGLRPILDLDLRLGEEQAHTAMLVIKQVLNLQRDGNIRRGGVSEKGR